LQAGSLVTDLHNYRVHLPFSPLYLKLWFLPYWIVLQNGQPPKFGNHKLALKILKCQSDGGFYLIMSRIIEKNVKKWVKVVESG
jgi:hypothetical protein